MKFRSILFLILSFSLLTLLSCCKDTKTEISIDFEQGQILPDIDIEFEYVDDINNKDCDAYLDRVVTTTKSKTGSARTEI